MTTFLQFKSTLGVSRKPGVHSQLIDRIEGVLLGLAAGDRIGGPIKMATLLAESLIANSTYDSSDVEKRYIEWWSQDGFDTGIVSEKVFSLVSRGMHRAEAINKVNQELNGMTAGCNPVHRCMHLAMCGHLRDEEISEIAEQESLLTHKHHIAGLVSAASVQLARSLINGAEWSDAVTKLENISSPARFLHKR